MKMRMDSKPLVALVCSKDLTPDEFQEDIDTLKYFMEHDSLPDVDPQEEKSSHA